MTTDASLVEYSATQEIIINLKSVKEQQNLSIPQIKQMVDETGTYISLTTLRRVFAENSETEDSFNYENTIRPIAQALLINYGLSSDNELRRVRTEAYEAIFRHLNEEIDAMKRLMETMKTQYENRIAFLRQQIATKDKYMNRKDAIIQTLMKKVFGEELALDDDTDDTEQP